MPAASPFVTAAPGQPTAPAQARQLTASDAVTAPLSPEEKETTLQELATVDTALAAVRQLRLRAHRSCRLQASSARRARSRGPQQFSRGSWQKGVEIHVRSFPELFGVGF